MNRVDRLFGITYHAAIKKHVTASQIADKYDISVCAVYRDIKALEEISTPVAAQ
jgi:predicted DNA-binding transcriptional regulator YafY